MLSDGSIEVLMLTLIAVPPIVTLSMPDIFQLSLLALDTCRPLVFVLTDHRGDPAFASTNSMLVPANRLDASAVTRTSSCSSAVVSIAACHSTNRTRLPVEQTDSRSLKSPISKQSRQVLVDESKTWLLVKQEDSVAATHSAGPVGAARVKVGLQVRQVEEVVSEQVSQFPTQVMDWQVVGKEAKALWLGLHERQPDAVGSWQVWQVE